MTPDELKLRTKKFAIDIIKFLDKIESKSKCLNIISNQLIRSASSVGANYRAACRARSQAEFISKIKIVEEEADECQYWIELLVGAEIVSAQSINGLLKEAQN